jgi:hypothetical protein
MYLELSGIDKRVPDYHGEDIGPILRAYKVAHYDAPVEI